MTSSRVEGREFAVGEALPGFVTTPTPLTIFLFGVSYWTAHRTHYDDPFARSEGYDGILVPGPMMNAYLVRIAVAWVGDASLLRRFSSRNLAVTTAGQELTVGGEVASIDDTIVTCDLSVTSNKGLVVSATATFHLAFDPPRPDIG